MTQTSIQALEAQGAFVCISSIKVIIWTRADASAHRAGEPVVADDAEAVVEVARAPSGLGRSGCPAGCRG